MSHLHSLQRFLQETFQFRGQVVEGGSGALGEKSGASDADWYLVASGFRELGSLLRHKQALIDWKKKHGVAAQCILVTPWLMRHKFFYLYGYDAGGEVHASGIDAKLLRNNLLKVAYQELACAEFFHEKSSYRLGKALLYGVWSLGFSLRTPALCTPPFLSVRRLEEVLPGLRLSLPVEQLQTILRYKLTAPERPVSREERECVAEALDLAYKEMRKRPLAWRNYLVYTIFSLREKNFPFLPKNPDLAIIDGFREAIRTGDRKLFEQTKRYTNMVLVV